MLGMPAPLVPWLRGYLPLPALPAGARLTDVQTRAGEVAVFISLPPVDEALTPALARQLRRRLLG
jgi:hypothetical protein